MDVLYNAYAIHSSTCLRYKINCHSLFCQEWKYSLAKCRLLERLAFRDYFRDLLTVKESL